MPSCRDLAWALPLACSIVMRLGALVAQALVAWSASAGAPSSRRGRAVRPPAGSPARAGTRAGRLNGAARALVLLAWLLAALPPARSSRDGACRRACAARPRGRAAREDRR